MTVADVGSYTLGEINIGLAAGLGLLNPLLLQFDLFMTGQFGIGSFLADIQVQFTSAISSALQLNVALGDPLAAIRALLAAFVSLQAALSVALSFGLPTASLQIGLQISAVLALSASLSLKLGGIKAMTAAGLAIKIPALRFAAKMAATLAAGPAHLVTFRGNTLAGSGAELAALFSAGLGPSDPLHPGDLVDGILIVTKDPIVFQALAAILKTTA
jgi:hypothetical protein